MKFVFYSNFIWIWKRNTRGRKWVKILSRGSALNPEAENMIIIFFFLFCPESLVHMVTLFSAVAFLFFLDFTVLLGCHKKLCSYSTLCTAHVGGNGRRWVLWGFEDFELSIHRNCIQWVTYEMYVTHTKRFHKLVSEQNFLSRHRSISCKEALNKEK